MNQILSIITAVVMFLTGLGAVTGTLEAPVAEEMTVTLDAEAIGGLIDSSVPQGAPESVLTGADQTKAAARLAANLLNNLRIRLIVDRGYAEIALLQNDSPLLNLAGRADHTGLAVASSLLPGTAITILPETAQKLIMEFLSQMSQQIVANNPLSALQNIDVEKLSAALEEAYARLTEEMNVKVGTAETGKYIVGDYTFTRKTPVNVTVQELKLIVLNEAKGLLENEALKPVLEMVPDASSLKAELDRAILAASREEPKGLDIALFEDPDKQDAVLRIAKTAADGEEYQGPVLIAGMVNKQIVVSADTGKTEQPMQLNAVADEQKMTMNFTASVPGDKTVVLSAEADADGSRVALAYDGKELLRIAEVRLMPEKVERITDGTKGVIRVEDLLADAKGEVVKTLKGKLISGVMLTAGKLMTLIGAEENADLLSRIIPDDLSLPFDLY